jgi:hypothetical protein
MKRFIGLLLLAGAIACPAAATTLTGTIKRPDGVRLNGKIRLTLSYPARDSTDATVVVPTTVEFPVSAGSLPASAAVVGNDRLEPVATYYWCETYNAYGAVVARNPYYISGYLFDIGQARPTTITTSNIGFADLSPTVYSVKTYGARGDGSTDDTASVQRAIDAASPNYGVVFFPAGNYVINADLNATGLANKTYGLLLRSNITMRGPGAGLATLTYKNGCTVSGHDPQMLWAGPTGTLTDVTIEDLKFAGNSASNPMIGTVPDQRNGATIYIGSNVNGQGVTVTRLKVERCTFSDWSGMNVIVLQDRSNAGSAFSSDILISECAFWDVGKGANIRDHSTVNIFARFTRIVKCAFGNPSTASTNQLQFCQATEIHGGPSVWNNNTVSYFAAGPIFSDNLFEDWSGAVASGNTLTNLTYMGFYVQVSAGVTTKTLDNLDITGNTIQFSATASPAAPYGGPYKYGLCVFSGKDLGAISFNNNIVIGAESMTDQAVGAAGITPSGMASAVAGVKFFTVNGNIFRRLWTGIWSDPHTGISYTYFYRITATGNQFLDFYDPTGGAIASGILVNGLVGQPVAGLYASGNLFSNVLNEATYKYGILVQNYLTDFGIGINSFNNIKTANIYITGATIAATQGWLPPPIVFANIATAVGLGNGSVVYCSDCTIANPCAGAGTGAIAKRLNGAWVCN